MIKDIVENGDKVVKIAEQIQVGGTITTIMSIMLLAIFSWGSWIFYKWTKNSMIAMRDMSLAAKEMAESNRTLVDSNIKKDENLQYHLAEFNSVRKSHIEEIKRVNDSACGVEKRLEKVENKQEIMMVDVKEIKAKLNTL